MGVCSGKLPAIPNFQFTHCIMHKLHDWSKKMLRQRFRLDLCTKQVGGQCKSVSSSSIAKFGMRTLQADNCLNPEQNGTLFIYVGGWVSFRAIGPKFGRACLRFFWTPPVRVQNSTMNSQKFESSAWISIIYWCYFKTFQYLWYLRSLCSSGLRTVGVVWCVCVCGLA